jgi:hypothetical protein
MLLGSVCSPHVHCVRFLLVILLPRSFTASQSSYRVYIRALIDRSFLSRNSMRNKGIVCSSCSGVGCGVLLVGLLEWNGVYLCEVLLCWVGDWCGLDVWGDVSAGGGSG